jgi:7,8-dihydro-6-hydroxymethylpterin-pyrophosphokinase
MLGANLNGEENIRKIREKLSDYFEIIDESSILVTKPIGKKYKTDFANQAIKIITDESAKVGCKNFQNH